jgi:hypothetical protein
VSKAKAALGPARRATVPAVVPVLFDAPLSSVVRLAAVQKPLDALTLADLDAHLAEARHAALTAILRTEDLEEAGKNDSAEWKQAATETLRAQRQTALLEAQRNLLLARQALAVAPEKTRPEATKKVADAEKALAKAEADIKLPDATTYTRRPLPVYPKTSTGRRLAFARWLADRDNPLTARVAVNHVWLRHFGQAIVPSVFDFGRNGRPASHPALLDWLAAEFMDPLTLPSPPPGGEGRVRGWGMKHLHRLIVTSSTYRQASTPDDADLALDRDNKYLWRMPSRRVEAEVVRDCVFYVAGKLDLTMGGPDLDHALGMTVPRRSLYFRHAAEKQMEFLKLFDSASVTECYQRKESVLPQQALALANSELTLRHARILARTLHARVGADPGGFVTAGFEQVLSRTPTADELAECVAFLKEQTQRHAADKAPPAPPDPDGRAPAADPSLRARENLIHVLLNHNDFVTVR